jgi:hypothetical protein
MNRFRLALVVIGSASAVLLTATSAQAGLRTFLPVSINDTAMNAQGALGAARSTSDTRQYLSCKTSSDTSNSVLGQCFAVNADGVFRSCFTFNANLVAAMRSIGSDASVLFGWDVNGACTGVSVYSGSDTPPKIQ